MARTRAQDYKDKRDMIRHKAVELFAQHGFANTSISLLAQHCGSSKARLYHYYTSKEAILFEVFDLHTRELLEAVDQIEPQGVSPETALRECLSRFMKIYEQSQQTHLVLLFELNRLSPEQREVIAQREREVVERIARLIDPLAAGALQRTPELRKPLAMTLMGMINWTFTWLRRNGPVSHEHYAKLAGTIFLEGLAAMRR